MAEKITDASHIIDLIGHSIFHPDIDKLLMQFDAVINDKSKLRRYDIVKSKTFGITFAFWYKGFYEKAIRPAKSIFKLKDEHEVILYELTFRQLNKEEYVMPFGLLFGDTGEVVIGKLGQKPFTKGRNSEDEATWIFYNDYFKIMTVFDKNLKLDWLRIWGLDINDKKKIEFKNNLKAQNKNINGTKIQELITLKDNKPTGHWAKRLSEGDLTFNELNIKESSEILDKFIDDLVEAIKSRKASSIYSKTKNAVVNFNKLNKKHKGFIDTLEREELVDFIQEATKLTGLTIDENVDITEDVRQW